MDYVAKVFGDAAVLPTGILAAGLDSLFAVIQQMAAPAGAITR